MSAAPRIRWERLSGNEYAGYVAGIEPRQFQIWQRDGCWALTSNLPGQALKGQLSADVGPLQALAEYWLVEGVEALGAEFPAPAVTP